MIDRRAVLALPALLIAGCGGKEPPPPPPVLNLTIVGSNDQNPDTAGHGNPVAVRLFQLSGTAAFERADFFALSEREKPTLGEDDLGSEEFIIRPGETRTVTREMKPATRFIGIAVGFRDIDRATWRATAPVAASGPSPRTVTISGLSAKLASS